VSDSQKPLADLEVDLDNLYREESFTDLKAASIRRMVPMKRDGSDDDGRPALYLGETTILSARGPLPVSAPIEAASLEEAVQKFPDAIQAAVERLIEEAREMQRQEMNRIVVPGSPGAPPMPPGTLGGGGGGGGKIIP